MRFPPLAALLFLITPVLTHAGQNSADAGAQMARLSAVGKVWATVKYFHPYLAYRRIDWDKALLDTLPKIREARNRGEYAAAVESMLSALKDPLTHVLLEGQKASAPAGSAPQRLWIHYGLPAYANGWPGFYSAFLNRPGSEPSVMSQWLDSNLAVQIRLSEPMESGAATTPAPERDRAYAETEFPRVELRILAAYRLWGAVHYFFGYKDLMDEDWDAAFTRLLPKFISAKDAREYHLTVAELVRNLADAHAIVESTEMTRYFGESPMGLRVRLLDRKPVITEVLDPAAQKAGIKAGDVVVKLDGENLAERIRGQAKYVSASTQQGLGWLVCQRVLNGPDGSSGSLTISDADGSTKEVTFKRSADYAPSLAQQRTGDVVRILAGNIGYVDLDRLGDADVNAALDRVRKAGGIIFDLRGRFGPSLNSIAPRLTEKRDVPAMIVTGPLLLEPDFPRGGSETSTASYFLSQTVPASDDWKYKGKTVMLVDERTAGLAEEAALFFEAANGTEFIGTPTAGVAGHTTNLILPGGILVWFSGQDVRHGNGSPLQRLGLQPSSVVPPSRAGIQAGRDEVLEKALALFNAHLK